MIQLKTNTLKQLINKTLYAASTDENRSNLYNILIENTKDGLLKFVATNGHVLNVAQIKVISTDERKVIVDKNALRNLAVELADDLDAQLTIEDNAVNVTVGDHMCNLPVISCQFPDYNQVIPSNVEAKLTVDRAKLINAVKRMSLLCPENSHGVCFQHMDGKLQIRANNPDLGEAYELLDVIHDGKEGTRLAMSGRYLFDALEHLDNLSGNDNATLKVTGELSPVIIESPSDTNFKSVIMPMRA